jgi:hypothetical protein
VSNPPAGCFPFAAYEVTVHSLVQPHQYKGILNFSSNNSHVSVVLVSKHIEEEKESRRRSEKEEKKVNQWRRSLKQRERGG